MIVTLPVTGLEAAAVASAPAAANPVLVPRAASDDTTATVTLICTVTKTVVAPAPSAPIPTPITTFTVTLPRTDVAPTPAPPISTPQTTVTVTVPRTDITPEPEPAPAPAPSTSKPDTVVTVTATVTLMEHLAATAEALPAVKRAWDDHPHGPPPAHSFHHVPDASVAASLSSTTPSSTSSEIVHGAHPTSSTKGNGNGNGAEQGSAFVINACPFTVMSNIVHGTSASSNGIPEEIYSSIAPGQTVSHPFSHDPNTGVSWKIWRTDIPNQAPVQFEYAWIPEVKRTWWDLSMIDAGSVDWLEEENAGKAIVGDQDGYGAYVGQVGVKHAFVDEGMSLVPSVQEGICEAVLCRPGEQFCKTAYNVWNDWGQQRDCAEHVDLTLTLCG